MTCAQKYFLRSCPGERHDARFSPRENRWSRGSITPLERGRQRQRGISLIARRVESRAGARSVNACAREGEILVCLGRGVSYYGRGDCINHHAVWFTSSFIKVKVKIYLLIVLVALIHERQKIPMKFCFCCVCVCVFWCCNL